jgi:hypothetical protein
MSTAWQYTVLLPCAAIEQLAKDSFLDSLLFSLQKVFTYYYVI